MTDTQLVEVTQADRDNVHRLLFDKAFTAHRNIDGKHFVQGAVAYSDVLEAFAAHRIAHQSPTSVSREAVAVELAVHFASRPWADMAEDRRDLRKRYRGDQPAGAFDINEPTREDCRYAADAVIALLSLSEKKS